MAPERRALLCRARGCGLAGQSHALRSAVTDRLPAIDLARGSVSVGTVSMAKKVSRFQKLREDALALFDERALGSLTEFSNWQKFAHFWVLVWRSFTRNRCPVRASALAYVTVLALIPMLAVAMSISSALLKQEGEEQIDQFIVKLVASVIPPATLGTNSAGAAAGTTNPAVLASLSAAGATTPAEPSEAPSVSAGASETNTNQPPASAEAEQVVKARRAIARYIHEFIQNTRSGTLGVTGSILLIFAAISMLSRIEDTFNDIWGVTRGRSWFMRIVLYWGVISLAPMLLIVALGLATGLHLE